MFACSSQTPARRPRVSLAAEGGPSGVPMPSLCRSRRCGAGRAGARGGTRPRDPAPPGGGVLVPGSGTAATGPAAGARGTPPPRSDSSATPGVDGSGSRPPADSASDTRRRAGVSQAGSAASRSPAPPRPSTAGRRGGLPGGVEPGSERGSGPRRPVRCRRRPNAAGRGGAGRRRHGARTVPPSVGAGHRGGAGHRSGNRPLRRGPVTAAEPVPGRQGRPTGTPADRPSTADA